MKNAVQAQSYYGTPVSGFRLAPTAGAKIAAPSAPYIGRNRCIANEDTCEGPKARGTDYCIGHLRSQEKVK